MVVPPIHGGTRLGSVLLRRTPERSFQPTYTLSEKQNISIDTHEYKSQHASDQPCTATKRSVLPPEAEWKKDAGPTSTPHRSPRPRTGLALWGRRPDWRRLRRIYTKTAVYLGSDPACKGPSLRGTRGYGAGGGALRENNEPPLMLLRTSCTCRMLYVNGRISRSFLVWDRVVGHMPT